jgi:hypothetical protein
MDPQNGGLSRARRRFVTCGLSCAVRQFQSRFAKETEIFETGIDDVLSYLHYPQPHRVRISSTHPLERLDLEIRRRARANCGTASHDVITLSMRRVMDRFSQRGEPPTMQ